MARTTPVNTGYTIASSVTAEGSVGERVDVWVEYLIGEVNTTNQKVWLNVYFYAQTQAGKTTGASYVGGLNSTFNVNNVAGESLSGATYDFRTDATLHTLGYWSGEVGFSANSIPVVGEFTTKSSTVSGGSIVTSIPIAGAVTYTVTFNALGGTPEPPAQTIVAGSSMVLPVVKRNGYEFMGWNDAATATSGIVGAYTPTRSLTLYAIWKERTGSYVYYNNNGIPVKCEVYFNINGSPVRCDVFYNNNGTPVQI